MARPAGVLNGEGEHPLPAIKKWTPRHEMVVYYHVVHMLDGVAIAEKVNLTPGRVSQILADPQARERIGEVRRRLKQSLMENVDLRLAHLANNALERVEHTVNRVDLDIILHPDAKKHQDRLSFDLLTKLGVIGGGEEKERKKDDSLTEPLMKRLLYAIEKADAAEEIRRAGGEGRIVEAVVEVEGEEEEGSPAEDAEVLE